MKKIFLISIVFISNLFISCSGGSDSDLPENSAPSVPVLSEPTNNKLCIDNKQVFKWNSSVDPDGDNVKYELQLAKDNSFTSSLNYTSTTNSRNITMEKGRVYYWRVRAKDDHAKYSDYSQIFKITTEGISGENHSPIAPTVVKPVNNTTVDETEVTLEWTAGDVDLGDVLTFDIYFGTVNPPTEKISSDLNKQNLKVELSPGTWYYWKVISKDNHGAMTESSVWKFRTN